MTSWLQQYFKDIFVYVFFISRDDLKAKKIQARKPSDKNRFESDIRLTEKNLMSAEDELHRLIGSAESQGSTNKVRDWLLYQDME